MKKRTKFAICAIVAILVYTAIVLVLSWFEKPVPPELTVAYFSAWTVELGYLYGIKKHDKEN